MTSDHEDFDPNPAVRRDEDADGRLDANAAGGALREIFCVDLTAAGGTCAGCAHTFVLAQALLYSRAPGLVGRCPACEGVLFRLVRGPGTAWLDMRGIACLQLALPEQEVIPDR